VFIKIFRTQLNRWKNEAIQIAQEADSKLRNHRQDKQTLTIEKNDLLIEMKDLVEKNGQYSTQLTEAERDRAQLTARIAMLQQKLKPFLANL
jgi:SMC interacting uncharacterized protein involved in chromosome segregation